MRSFVTIALSVCLSFAASAQTRWDLPTAYPASNFHTENIVQFVKEVEKASAGKLKISVHANASLFKAPEIKRAVQGGQAQMGEILLGNYANEWAVFGADALPFLADSYDSAMRLYKAQRPLIQNKLGEQGMLLLYSVPWPPQAMFSKKPINTIGDLKGSKFRSQNPSTARLGELLGAQSVTIQAAELSQALATGLVESYMSSGSTGYDTKTYEHIKYLYDTQAWLPKNAVIVNKAAFDALDKATQAAVLQAAAAAEVRGWAASKAANDESLALLKQHGMHVLPPSAALKSELKTVGDTMLREWLQKSGKDGDAVISTFLRL